MNCYVILIFGVIIVLALYVLVSSLSSTISENTDEYLPKEEEEATKENKSTHGGREFYPEPDED